MNRFCLCIAVVAAIALATVGFVRGTYAAGGSDSSCYALMADAFAAGKLQPSSALVSQVPWPDASNTFAPGGFLPSRSDPAAAAPVCAPGFSLLLAPVVKLGGPDALFAVTPIAGALLVWLSFLAARMLANPPAGAMAAVLVAASPIVLFQVVQPMNDIVTATLWMAVFASLISRRWVVAGACCGLALLVRPNLLPLAIVAGVYALLAQSLEPRAHRARAAAALMFALSAAPFVAVIFWLNSRLYGGPLSTGYGQAANLFALTNVPRNAVRYFGWMMDTQTPFPWLGFAAPFLLARASRSPAILAVGLVGATACVYFAYTPFDDWSYLRFLIPAVALLLVSASAVTAALAAKLPSRGGAVVVIVVTLALAAFGVREADDRLAFTMHTLEQRYRSAGIVVRDRLPPDAAVMTTWDSGAIRFHARKDAIVWDALDPDWLDRGVDWLAVHGHRPFILVESWEEARFRQRFSGHSTLGNLDWPPRYEVDRVVRIYDPGDRDRYLRGEQVRTEYLWPFGVGKN